MRNRNIWFIIIMSMLLCACTNRQLVTDDSLTEDEPGETYGFTLLEIHFDTQKLNEALVGRYNEQNNQIEAVYENKIDGMYLFGNDAVEKLDNIFREMELTPEMEDTDLLQKVSEGFQLHDFTTLKLTITFQGYETKELMLTK